MISLPHSQQVIRSPVFTRFDQLTRESTGSRPLASGTLRKRSAYLGLCFYSRRPDSHKGFEIKEPGKSTYVSFPNRVDERLGGFSRLLLRYRAPELLGPARWRGRRGVARLRSLATAPARQHDQAHQSDNRGEQPQRKTWHGRDPVLIKADGEPPGAFGTLACVRPM